MAPKAKKKRPVRKPPPYQTADPDLAPFGVRVGDLVRTALGCTATVLGVKSSSSSAATSTSGGEGLAGPQLWVQYANGLEAPVEPRSVFTAPPAAPGPAVGEARDASRAGFQLCSTAEHLSRDIAVQQREKQELNAKWAAYNDEQARKRVEAEKAAAKRKKKKAQLAAEAPGQQQPDSQQQQRHTTLAGEADAAGTAAPSARTRQ